MDIRPLNKLRFKKSNKTRAIKQGDRENFPAALLVYQVAFVWV